MDGKRANHKLSLRKFSSLVCEIKKARDRKNNMYIESSGHLEIKFVTFLNTIFISDEISVVYFSARSKMNLRPKMSFLHENKSRPES